MSIQSVGPELFGSVEQFIDELFAPHDEALTAALDDAAAAGLPRIEISAAQGRFLQMLAHFVGARRILEIGTLGGYSTIWLARGLPGDGRLISLELDPARVDVARASIARAGLAARVEVRAGPALDSLRAMLNAGEPQFDLAFIDADEPTYVDYLDLVLQMAHPGTVIVADNVIREGAVVDPDTTNERARGARRFLEALAAQARVESTVIPLIGGGSYDGMAIARVLDQPNNR